jgi:uncharacterized surface protein with fasciclin (FAS1) repeats
MRRILSLLCLVPVFVDVVRAQIISVDNFKLIPESGDSGCNHEIRPEYSIMDLVSNNDRLQLMEQTILHAGMEHLFQQQLYEQSTSSSSNSRLTLFAPTNAAFWNLDATRPGFLDLLLRDDWTFHLQDLVLHHVTSEGEFCRDHFYDQETLALQNGGQTEVMIDDDRVFLLPSPDLGEIDGIDRWQLEMVEFDESASNGVIHEIHRVFVTQWFFRDAFLAAQEEGYSTFSEMVTLTGLEDTFRDTYRIMTVFYPTNEAFAKLPPDTLHCWMEHPDILAQVLLSHAVHGVLHSTTLHQQAYQGPFSYTTLHGIPLSVDSSDGTTTLNGGSHLVQADILTYHGISHGIDNVLLFPELECPFADPVAISSPPPSPSLIDVIPPPTSTSLIDVIPPTTTSTSLFEVIPTPTSPSLNEVIPPPTSSSNTDVIPPTSSLVEVLPPLTSVPPSPAVDEPILTVLELLHEQPNYLNISHMISIAGPDLESMLSDSYAQLTFFAPIDNAFEHVPPEIMSCLMTTSGNTDHQSTLLSSFLLYHLVTARKLWSVDMAEGSSTLLTSAEGAPLLIHRSDPTIVFDNGVTVDDGSILLEVNSDGSIVVERDIPAYNGVIHGISRVLFSPDFSCDGS